jgi:hypothetical protein
MSSSPQQKSGLFREYFEKNPEKFRLLLQIARKKTSQHFKSKIGSTWRESGGVILGSDMNPEFVSKLAENLQDLLQKSPANKSFFGPKTLYSHSKILEKINKYAPQIIKTSDKNDIQEKYKRNLSSKKTFQELFPQAVHKPSPSTQPPKTKDKPVHKSSPPSQLLFSTSPPPSNSHSRDHPEYPGFSPSATYSSTSRSVPAQKFTSNPFGLPTPPKKPKFSFTGGQTFHDFTTPTAPRKETSSQNKFRFTGNPFDDTFRRTLTTKQRRQSQPLTMTAADQQLFKISSRRKSV